MSIFPPEFEPKIVTTIREGYSFQSLGRDALAGIVVGIVAFPLAIAFAIASGVRPEQGLYTAIVAGIAISLFGGSRVQIGGPTGAFVVLVAGVVGQFGYEGLAVATLMAGCFLVVMALARLGDVIRFMPYPVTVGFTTGIALIIATGQIGDALGLDLGLVPAEFLGKLTAYTEQIHSVNPGAVAIFLGTIAIIQLWPRIGNRLPGPMVAIIATTAVVHLLDLGIDTIHSRFGDVPSSFPTLHSLSIDWGMIPDLVSPAITIALLAAIESLLSAVVADGLIGGRHRSNAELMAQGIANMASPLFGGIPATGAIARTATNVRNGGRSPVAGIVHAGTLLLILVIAGEWASLIPMATLAGILVVVAYNMSEWHVFLRLMRGPRSDMLVLITTFLLTVGIGLTVAIQAGVVLASLLFMRRMAEVTQVKPIRDIVEYDRADLQETHLPEIPPGIEVFEINGTFCFGAASKFTEVLLASRSQAAVVILRMRNVIAIDATGLHALEEVASRLAHSGTRLLLSGVHAQPLIAMERSGAVKQIGEQNLFPAFADALSYAQGLLSER